MALIHLHNSVGTKSNTCRLESTQNPIPFLVHTFTKAVFQPLAKFFIPSITCFLNYKLQEGFNLLSLLKTKHFLFNKTKPGTNSSDVVELKKLHIASIVAVLGVHPHIEELHHVQKVIIKTHIQQAKVVNTPHPFLYSLH